MSTPEDDPQELTARTERARQQALGKGNAKSSKKKSKETTTEHSTKSSAMKPPAAAGDAAEKLQGNQYYAVRVGAKIQSAIFLHWDDAQKFLVDESEYDSSSEMSAVEYAAFGSVLEAVVYLREGEEERKNNKNKGKRKGSDSSTIDEHHPEEQLNKKRKAANQSELSGGESDKGMLASTQRGNSSGYTEQNLDVVNDMAIMKEEVKKIREENRAMHQKFDRLITRIGNSPLPQGWATARRDEGSSRKGTDNHEHETHQQNGNATLSRLPEDLWILWQEYTHGIDGRKPAKDFTTKERGQVRGTYSKRNHVWQLIQKLMDQRGVDHNVAIDSIYEVYGYYGKTTSVAEIIKAIQGEKKKRDIADFPLAQKQVSANSEEGASKENTDNHEKNENTQHNGEATLSKCPRSLQTLWREYTHGIDGRKPAKDFTEKERGRASHNFCKRNHIWQLIQQLMDLRGVDHNAAIDSIYEVYGKSTSITAIIKAISEDKFTGEIIDKFFND